LRPPIRFKLTAEGRVTGVTCDAQVWCMFKQRLAREGRWSLLDRQLTVL
jgi:hypothetical protein